MLIGLQLTAQHWFYLYIVWFYPLLLIVLSSGQSQVPKRGQFRGSKSLVSAYNAE